MNPRIDPSRIVCRRLVAAALVMAPLALSIPFAGEPLGRDQGYFSYGGWRILHGELPYRDFWTNTFPAVFWWYALMERASGIPLSLWNGLILGITSVLLCRTASGRAGLWAGLGYGVAGSLLHRFWDMGQAEQLVNLFVAGSLALRSRPLLRGILVGAAILAKPIAVLAIPIVFLFTGAGRALLGMTLPLAAWLLPYAFTGGMSRIWQDLIVYNAGYGSSTFRGDLAGRAARGVFRWGAPLTPALVLGLWALIHGAGRAGTWLGLALASVILQGKLFSYHWIVALPPTMLLAGAGLDDLLRRGWRGRLTLGVFCLAPVLALPGTMARAWYPALEEARRGIGYVAGELPRVQYLGDFGDKARGADFSALDQYRVAERLKTMGCETLLVWGFEPGVNYAARIRCPTRYVADFPLSFEAGTEPARRLRHHHRTEFIREIRTYPPDCIVVVLGDANPVERLDSYGQMMEFEEFAEFLMQQYDGPVRVGSYLVWERA